MATLQDALDMWPGAYAEWNGLRLRVGREDEKRDGEMWEGYGYHVNRTDNGKLVATDDADDVDMIAEQLSRPPVGIPTNYDGWYWIDAYGRRQE